MASKMRVDHNDVSMSKGKAKFRELAVLFFQFQASTRSIPFQFKFHDDKLTEKRPRNVSVKSLRIRHFWINAGVTGS